MASNNFERAKEHAEEMWSAFSGLHDVQAKMDEMINMEWDSQIKRKDVKQTISPEPVSYTHLTLPTIYTV